MKIKRLCVLAVLLTSSLTGAANNSASKSEDQYYAGLNFGAGWGGGLKIKPSVVFGYHYDKSSKLELEVLTDISDMFGGKDAEGKDKEKKMGASLLVNYRYYPDVDIDPVKLYVSGGLGGHVQVYPFGIVGTETLDKILGSISYKLKVGVDYEITPQIVGTAGIAAGGRLSGIKAKQILDATLEVGIRYNF
ncbi:hypothetical protein NOX90_06785 [Wolbachia endosymbiont of Anurida maritima]|uniref:outer membrane beta-barrel protein n=1 Tax=Wolbachia endosymbiont of Anurida maritima TaxID=2850562 RepID=UPI0035D06F94